MYEQSLLNEKYLEVQEVMCFTSLKIQEGKMKNYEKGSFTPRRISNPCSTQAYIRTVNANVTHKLRKRKQPVKAAEESTFSDITLADLRLEIPLDAQILPAFDVLDHQTLFVGQVQETDEAVRR